MSGPDEGGATGGPGAAAPLRYAPYGELRGRPSVVVDGSPADGTVLCLSHWPGIASPADLQEDLSAQMAFRYLRVFDRHAGAELVSNNHFDQDGLVSVYALAFPQQALAREHLLVDVASAGDFGCYRRREAARISMTIAAYATPERSPVPDLSPNYGTMTAQLYHELLPRLDELCDHPDRFRAHWADEDATLSQSEAAIAGGAVTIEEDAELDLAVVTVPEGAPGAGGHRFGGMWVGGLHPMAVYNATDRLAVLTVRGRTYELAYRYESWVQYQSRRPRPRVGLEALADRLSEEEPAGARWVADSVSALTPTLRLDGGDAGASAGAESGIPLERFRILLADHLRTAPPVWDPYRRDEP